VTGDRLMRPLVDHHCSSGGLSEGDPQTAGGDAVGAGPEIGAEPVSGENLVEDLRLRGVGYDHRGPRERRHPRSRQLGGHAPASELCPSSARPPLELGRDPVDLVYQGGRGVVPRV
jgi:hypothetical protein